MRDVQNGACVGQKTQCVEANFAVVVAIIYLGERRALPNGLSLPKADAMFVNVLAGFVVIPIKLRHCVLRTTP